MLFYRKGEPIPLADLTEQCLDMFQNFHTLQGDRAGFDLPMRRLPNRLQYALLETIKSVLPALPPREAPKLTLSEGAMELDIAAPLLTVYRLMTDLNNRKYWVQDVRDAEGDKPIDRIGVQHRCFFDDMTAEITPAHSEVHEDKIHYVEFSHIPQMGLKCFGDFVLTKKGENLTHTVIKLGMAPGQELPAEVVAGVLQSYQASCESFKTFCESHV